MLAGLVILLLLFGRLGKQIPVAQAAEGASRWVIPRTRYG